MLFYRGICFIENSSVVCCGLYFSFTVLSDDKMTNVIKYNEAQENKYYSFLKELGSGTFGTVDLCVKKHNKQKIVVKKIIINDNEERLMAARVEMSIMKCLSHPNTILYLDSFIRSGVFYILMEYASQGTLHDYLFKCRPKHLEPQPVVSFFCQILMGLDHIHVRNIMHRDLKPENIFVTGVKADVLKIGDFGASTFLSPNEKITSYIGTPNYMSPEMCDRKPYDTKADIWALGCILYELCALERMFEGPSEREIIARIKSGNRKCVDVYTYGQQLQDLINEMLNLDPDGRPDTVRLMTYPDIFPTVYALGADLGCI